jgi:hypothetical protein
MTANKRIKAHIKNLPELLPGLTLKGKRALLTSYKTRLSLVNRAISMIEEAIEGDLV